MQRGAANPQSSSSQIRTAAALLLQLAQLLLQPPNDSAMPEGSNSTGHAQMYSTQAVVAAVRYRPNRTDVWLDGGVIVSPMLQNATFHWSKECQQAFERLKSDLKSDACLRYPDLQRPFILTTDWSQVAVGAVLSQMQPIVGLQINI
jgi:hypothetical protein